MALVRQPQPEPQPTALDRIVNENTHCLSVMKDTAKVVFQLLWHSRDKTPQQVCDMMGTDAAKGFLSHAKLQELIYLIDPTWVPLVPPVGYTVNQNGTVTIGELV
jgi:hypothetical protein